MTAYELTDEQRQAAVSALHAYASETGHYLRGRDFEPCALACPHCAPRVEHFAMIRREMEERMRHIQGALFVLNTIEDVTRG